MKNVVKKLKISGKEDVFTYYEPGDNDCEELIARYHENDFSVYIQVYYGEYHQDVYKIIVSRLGFSYSHEYLNFQNTQKVLDQLIDIVNYVRNKFPERFELLHL